MFETKKDLREANERLERCLNDERHTKDYFIRKADKLYSEVRKLQDKNKLLEHQLDRKYCECACCCGRREVEKPMTLGEFDKAMEKIAVKYDLHFDVYRDPRERIYKFINPKIDRAGLCMHGYRGYGWVKIVILIDDFAVPASQLKDIEDDIVRNCL